MTCSRRISWRACGYAAGVVLLAATLARAAESESGFVVALHGKPVATEKTGQWRPISILQAVRDGETVILEQGDSLVVCNEPLAAAFDIQGPGAVILSRAGVTRLAGEPRISRTGACEGDATADSNGGVILRGVRTQHGTRPAVRPDP